MPMVGHDGVREKRNGASLEGLAQDALECVVISISREEGGAFSGSVKDVVGHAGNVHSFSSRHDGDGPRNADAGDHDVAWTAPGK